MLPAVQYHMACLVYDEMPCGLRLLSSPSNGFISLHRELITQ